MRRPVHETTALSRCKRIRPAIREMIGRGGLFYGCDNRAAAAAAAARMLLLLAPQEDRGKEENLLESAEVCAGSLSKDLTQGAAQGHARPAPNRHVRGRRQGETSSRAIIRELKSVGYVRDRDMSDSSRVWLKPWEDV